MTGITAVLAGLGAELAGEAAQSGGKKKPDRRSGRAFCIVGATGVRPSGDV